MWSSKLWSFRISYKKGLYKTDGKNELQIYRQESISSDCSSFAQSFVQVGPDCVQEVWRVDIMFIQLAAAGSQSRCYSFNQSSNVSSCQNHQKKVTTYTRFTKCLLTLPSHGCSPRGPWSSRRFPPLPRRLSLTSGRTWSVALLRGKVT